MITFVTVKTMSYSELIRVILLSLAYNDCMSVYNSVIANHFAAPYSNITPHQYQIIRRTNIKIVSTRLPDTKLPGTFNQILIRTIQTDKRAILRIAFQKFPESRTGAQPGSYGPTVLCVTTRLSTA